MSDQQPPRKNWPRVPLPPDMFELMITIARPLGYSERTLYVFIYQLLMETHSADIEKLRDYYKTAWIRDIPLEDEPPAE